MRRAFAIAFVASLSFERCERGCLSSWLAEHGADPGAPPAADPGAGGARPNGSGAHGGPATALDLGGTDCSDGLARCVDGHLQVSVPGHIPPSCTAPREQPGACSCAWRPAGACPDRCVSEGLEVVAADPSLLCTSPSVVLRAPTPAESGATSICAEENVSCEGGAIRACEHRGQPSRLVGVCVFGCAAGVALEPLDLLRPDGPAVILCQRDHAGSH